MNQDELLDHFAGLAMQALISRNDPEINDLIGIMAYDYAAEMLVARAQWHKENDF